MASYYHNVDKSKWGVRYWLPKDPATGKRKQKRSGLRFPTRDAAEYWYVNERARLSRNQGVDGADMTLRDYAELWFSIQSGRVRGSSAYIYRRQLDHYILPYLGGYILERLHPTAIEAWHADLANAGLGPGTIHRTHGLLCQVLRHADRRGTIANNPAALCWPPRPEARANAVDWEPSHITTFLDATTEPTDLIFRLILMTGLRLGEALALEWRDLDLKAGRLSVRRTQTRDRDGTWTIGPPKTPRSRRTLALPRSLMLELRAYRRAQYEARLAFPGWWDHDFVFCYGDGRPYPRNTMRDWLAAVCQRAGVPVISMHGLRRAATTWLVALNAHPRTMQARLGHTNIDMTMYYAHSADEFDQQLADSIDAALRHRDAQDGTG